MGIGLGMEFKMYHHVRESAEPLTHGSIPAST
jgi:hypothetical protein